MRHADAATEKIVFTWSHLYVSETAMSSAVFWNWTVTLTCLSEIFWHSTLFYFTLLCVGCGDGEGQIVVNKKPPTLSSTSSIMRQRINTLQRRVCFIFHQYLMLVGLSYIIWGDLVMVVVSMSDSWSWVRLPASAPSGNNSGQVVNSHVPLSSSSTIWYRPKGGDALCLGR